MSLFQVVVGMFAGARPLARNPAFGARAGATVLTRATTILGTLFMVGALGLGVVSRTGAGGSVVSGVGGPAATPTPTAPALPTMPATSPTPTAPVATPTTTPTSTPTPTPGKTGRGGDAPAPKPTPKKGGGA